jgi:hypothetical protein
MKLPSSEKEQLRKGILESVCRDHAVSMEEINSRKQSKRMVAARTDAIDRLKLVGFSDGNICRIFGRTPKFVRYHRNRHKELVRHRGRDLPHWTRGLSTEMRTALLQIAGSENVSVHVLMLEWVAERLNFEVQAKSRDNQGRGASNSLSRAMEAA